MTRRAVICSFFTVFFSIFFFGKASAQSPGFSWSIAPGYGFVLPHYKHMQHYITSHTFVLEFERQFMITPRVGRLSERPLSVKAHVMSPGNPEVFGYGVAACPEMKFRLGKTRRATFNLGVGVAYLTKKYDLENYRNIYIGSHFNAMIEFGFETRLWEQKYFGLTAKANWFHYSNGATRMPNKGLNMPVAGIVVSFFPAKAGGKTRDSVSSMPFQPFARWSFSAHFSVRQIYNFGARYGITGLMADRYFNPVNNSQFFVGAELSDDVSAGAKLKLSGKESQSSLDNLKASLHIGWTAYLDRVSVSLSLGTYCRNVNFREENLYERLALKYHLKKNLAFSIALKSHLTTADAIEYGINYIIP